jgi:Uma2 family endonuclease
MHDAAAKRPRKDRGEVITYRDPPPSVPFYIESDGRPMGETPRHVQVMVDTFTTLADYFAADPQVFIAANMFLHYVEGDRNKHVSPDVFLVRGIPRDREPERRSYRTWEEGGKGPDFVLEVTSASTRDEDQKGKFELYQNVLKAKELFLFDPYSEYLVPRLLGHRLRGGRYHRVRPVEGRLPRKVLGLHLEGVGRDLRLYDPRAGVRLLTQQEKAEVERERAEAEGRRAEAEGRRAEAEAEARLRAEEEVERLRAELEALRRQLRQGE